MTSIQVVLICFSLLAAIIGSYAFRSKLASRLVAVFFSIAAIGFILFPNSTTTVAHAVGVGRGTDLLLYIWIFAGIHAILMLHIQMRRLERKLTDEIRANAIRDAQTLGSTVVTSEPTARSGGDASDDISG
jgi:hypothetical protein